MRRFNGRMHKNGGCCGGHKKTEIKTGGGCCGGKGHEGEKEHKGCGCGGHKEDNNK